MSSVTQLFRNEGTEFRSHMATTPVCGPSRATLLTGRMTHNHGKATVVRSICTTVLTVTFAGLRYPPLFHLLD